MLIDEKARGSLLCLRWSLGTSFQGKGPTSEGLGRSHALSMPYYSVMGPFRRVSFSETPCQQALPPLGLSPLLTTSSTQASGLTLELVNLAPDAGTVGLSLLSEH